MTGPRWDSLSFSGKTARAPYFGVGVLLTAIKMWVDRAVAEWVFGRPWSPTNYALTGEIEGLLSLDRADQYFYLAMLAVALPFVAVGLVLTVRRLRDAGWPLWIACLFFAPLPINVVFLLVLALVPGRAPSAVSREVTWVDDLMDAPPSSKKGATAGSPTWATLGRLALAILPTLAAGAGTFYLMTSISNEYGWGLFLGLPVVLPMISVILFGYHRGTTVAQCMGVGQLWLLAAVLALLVTASEGMICILMALPLAVPVVLLGSCLGYAVLELGPGRPRELGRMVAALLATLPLIAGAEHLEGLKPPLYECVTSVEVDAPPSAVWRRVVSFPDLAPPRDFLSRAGVAYPIRARIEGAGVGAVRLCEFSTGAFVEPIEIWDEPRLLRFAVTDCPSPMREWNPFFARVHPRHLDGFLVSERGQFRLEELPGGRTRLEGTTWYRHGLWPTLYWRAWSDPILHGIHEKVLEHVKALAEADVARL